MASDPTDLRALAARVLGEKPTFALECEIRNAVEPDGPTVPRRYLTSHDAAFGAMPAGWRIFGIEQGDNGYSVTLLQVDVALVASAEAPDLPRAVTAAGLLARAAEMEQGDKS